MYNTEEEVARKAEQMLQVSLRNQTASFKDHVNRRDGDPSLKEATASARLKQYGSVRAGTKKKFMRSLAIKMARHGFIQHFGVNVVRAGGHRSRKRPKSTTYSFKAHVMSMPAKPFINQAVDNSRVVDFVMQNVTRIRGEEILVNIKKIMEQPGSTR